MFTCWPVPPPGISHLSSQDSCPSVGDEGQMKSFSYAKAEYSNTRRKGQEIEAFIVEKNLAHTILQNLEISDRKHVFSILRLAHDTVSTARSSVPQKWRFWKGILKLLLKGDYRLSFRSRGMACIYVTGGARKNKTRNSKANPCPPRGLLPKLIYKLIGSQTLYSLLSLLRQGFLPQDS